MPIVNERKYRAMPLMAGVADAENQFLVRGYATTFSDPYVLFTFEGKTYYEEIAPDAIDERTDMSDVIFQYDHQGMVFARMSNNSLSIACDDHGLLVEADLSRTADARNMKENITSGMVKDMSWAFIVDGQEFDKDTLTRKITHIKKIFDVSAVSIPANPNTEIGAARSLLDGAVERDMQEVLEMEASIDEEIRKQESKRKLIQILTNL